MDKARNREGDEKGMRRKVQKRVWNDPRTKGVWICNPNINYDSLEEKGKRKKRREREREREREKQNGGVPKTSIVVPPK